MMGWEQQQMAAWDDGLTSPEAVTEVADYRRYAGR
jgi:hypothetical protein